MAKKLIDANALYEFCSEQQVKETGAYSKGLNNALKIVKSALHNESATPTIDPVHAAGACYCRECKYKRKAGCMHAYISTDTIQFAAPYMKDTDFCSCGKIKTEE